MQHLARSLVPGLVILAVAAVLCHWPAAGGWLEGASPVLPVAVWLVGVLAGWRFHRSRVLFAVVALALAQLGLHVAGGGGLGAAGSRAVQQAVACLVPLNLGILYVVRERGIFSLHGVCRLGLVLVQAPAVALVGRYPGLRVCDVIARPLWAGGPAWSHAFPHVGLVLSALAVVIVLVGVVRRRGVLDAGFLWALLASLAALAMRGRPQAAGVYMAAAGVILAVSVVEASFGMAYRDELTGLPARRALNEALGRLGSPYAIAMIDVDHFKRFNDRYGHDVGDEVLRMVAERLAAMKGGGRVFRYGGEEFTAVFEGKERDEVVPALEAVRRAVGERPFIVRGSNRPRRRPDQPQPARRARCKVTITVSMGVADGPQAGGDPQAVVKAADKALYRAKHAGRNRVCT